MSKPINKKFITELRESLETITRANDFYQIWWYLIQLINNKLGPVRSGDTKPWAYEAVAEACLISMTVSISRLFDKRKDSMSIAKILKEAQRDSVITPNEFKELDSKLRHLSPTAEKVKVLRSNLHAHRVRFRTVEDIYTEARITPNQFRDLISGVFTVLNELANKLGSMDWSLKSAALEGFKEMVGGEHI